jgi:hypothetical protein
MSLLLVTQGILRAGFSTKKDEDFFLEINRVKVLPTFQETGQERSLGYQSQKTGRGKSHLHELVRPLLSVS